MNRKNYYADYMSRDYEKLQELLDAGNVVACYVDYLYDMGGRKVMFRDICKARAKEKSPYSIDYGYVIESRGIVYSDWDRNFEKLRHVSFADECERMRLEFIDFGYERQG